MQSTGHLTRSLKALKERLDHVNRTWAAGNHQALLGFFVRIIPRLLDAERCAIFILDPSTSRIISKAGTYIREGEIEAPREGSIVGRVVSSGQALIENELLDNPGFHHTADAKTGFLTRSLVCAPIRSVAGTRITGAVEVLNKRQPTGFTLEDGSLVQELADYLSMALENILLNEEILGLSSDLDHDVAHFRSAYLREVAFVAESAAMREVLQLTHMVSATPVNVVIQGENGTGKELIARMIHEGSERREQPFIAVNCAAIPENLMESEFFGYEKGAFTGADSARPGRFEEVRGGTLFLDEVADMPLAMQAKFLRVLQESEGSRLGSSRVIQYDLHLISASNRVLTERVASGEFREDLYYRLFSVEITVPPLRERREDIAPLLMAFLDDVCARYGRAVPAVPQSLLTLFEHYAWPGNVRQLRREVERLVALTTEGQPLSPERCSTELRGSVASLPPSVDTRDLRLPNRVQELEVALIRRALEQTGGNKLRAAELLAITRQGLHKKLKRYGLEA